MLTGCFLKPFYIGNQKGKENIYTEEITLVKKNWVTFTENSIHSLSFFIVLEFHKKKLIGSKINLAHYLDYYLM